MVRCDVQRWNMQKQIDATRYIVPYKTDDRMSIIVLRYARRRMRIVSQGRLTLWRHSALRCDVTPRYAVTWLFTRKTASHKTYTCQNITVYVSGHTETDTTGMLSPPTVWRQQSEFVSSRQSGQILAAVRIGFECRCNGQKTRIISILW